MTTSTQPKLNESRTLLADRYVVEQPLGEGGMGSIFRVLDTVTGTQLALKQLKLENESGSEAKVALFEREYHALKQLAHPRIIRVYDYGIANGNPYYTMELLDGADARELAPLEWKRACVVLRDIASSLAIVHSRRLVYRDVSPRNVRCTSDGRAKLLDFGALTPIGVPSHVVGTPACMPPEALFGQRLDQRSDLYALGALAYWLLAGQAPYRARQLSELRDAWRTRPADLSTLVPDVPPALSALVMSLLSHNPTARPQAAGEVIDKLSAIAQLPPDPDLGVVRAYLTTPELVGREEEVVRIRKAIIRATRGRGSALLLRARAGLGSTRLLDACVLEGKLAGALVAHVEARATGHRDFAAVRAAIEQWADASPPAMARELRAAMSGVKVHHPSVSGAPGMIANSNAPTVSNAPGSSAAASGQGTHANIAAAVLKLARERTLLLAVDDAHRIDSASNAVFALLARASTTHKLFMLASLPQHVELRESVSVRMLAEATQHIDLTPWTLPQTESLLQSLFGAVAGVPLLAERIQRVARGNPRDTMQLAQHLVDTGIVRLQAGAWVLPTQLGEVALPHDMEQAQRSVLDVLEDESRKLATTFALEPDLGRLSIAECAHLAPDALRLLDDLFRQGILVERGTGFAFRHRALATALSDALDEPTRRALHQRLAALHQASGHDPMTIAYHLHHAGESDACLAQVRAWAALPNDGRLSPEAAELLDHVVTDSQRYVLSPSERHRLRALLLQHASVFDPSYGRHGEPAFEQLRRDTGLSYWDEYPELEPTARIGRCLERALAAHEATPEAERGLHPLEALRELAGLVRSLNTVYARTLESEKLLNLASWIEPFRFIAPIIQLLYELTAVSADRAVREKRVAHRYLEFAQRFSQPIAGVDDIVRGSAVALCTYCAALDEAKQGKPEALERMAPLEQIESFAALAWHVRMLSHIYHGRTADAARCRERMELLTIEQNRPFTLLAMSVLYEAWGYEMCEDLTGLKGALELVDQESKRYPGWQPWSVLYRGDVDRLRGDVPAALARYEQAAAMTSAGKHQVWPHAAERRVVALRQLGRLDESIALGREIVQFAQEEDLEPVNKLRLWVALALSEAQAGMLDAARQNIDAALSCAAAEGIGGVPLGIVREAEARLAMHAHDSEAFERASQACADHLLSGENPALTAKYDRLMQEARAAGVTQTRSSVSSGSPQEALRLRLSTLSPSERGAMVLQLLLAGFQAEVGCLFGVTQHGAVHLAGPLDMIPGLQLTAAIESYLAAELTDTQMVTATQHDQQAAQSSVVSWAPSDQPVCMPVLLRGSRAGQALVSGVAVLQLKAAHPAEMDQQVLDALGQALLDADDTSGLREAR